MQRNLRFALFGNTYQEHKSAHVTHLLEILRDKGAAIYLPGRPLRPFLPWMASSSCVHKKDMFIYTWF